MMRTNRSRIYNSKGELIFEGNDRKANKIWAKMLSQMNPKWYESTGKESLPYYSYISRDTYNEFESEEKQKSRNKCPDCLEEGIEKIISFKAKRCRKHAGIARRKNRVSENLI